MTGYRSDEEKPVLAPRAAAPRAAENQENAALYENEENNSHTQARPMSPEISNNNDNNNGVHYPAAYGISAQPAVFGAQRSSSAYVVRRQAGDGNCLFRSMSDQLYGTPEHHALLRDRCAKYLASERGYFEQFVAEPYDAFLLRIARLGEWGDDVEIEALSEMFDVRVEIYASHSQQLMRTFHEVADSAWPHPLRLQYEGQSHYNSLAPHAGLVVKCRHAAPGETEDAAIERSRRRQELSRRAIGSSAESDAALTELNLLDESIRLSRREFEHRSDAEMDAAFEASRTEWERMEQKRMDKEVVEAILQQTRLEEEEKMLSQAMNLSRDAAPVGAAASSADAGDQYPESVYQLMSMGFPIEKCIQAYDLVGDSPEAMLQFCCTNLN